MQGGGYSREGRWSMGWETDMAKISVLPMMIYFFKTEKKRLEGKYC